MSLQTSTVIRTLQRKLYRKAKERKLLHRRRLRPRLFSVCLTMKPVGEPDAGDRHVRFDERDGKRSVAAWPKLPRPSSTLPKRTRRGKFAMSASLIGRLGSSAFRLSNNSSVDVAHGLSLLFGLGAKGPSIMGFEDEVEQSFGRPCRQCDGRFKRTYELTSSIVPRGTSFHR